MRQRGHLQRTIRIRRSGGMRIALGGRKSEQESRGKDEGRR
jgi:hypothetical protein